MANSAAQTFSYADATHYFTAGRAWRLRTVAMLSIFDATKYLRVIAKRSFFHPTTSA
jgi:hypothetical protein